MAAEAGHLGTGHGPAGAGHGHFGTGHVLISSGHGLLGIGRGPSLKRKYHDSFSEVDQEGYAKVSNDELDSADLDDILASYSQDSLTEFSSNATNNGLKPALNGKDDTEDNGATDRNDSENFDDASQYLKIEMQANAGEADKEQQAMEEVVEKEEKILTDDYNDMCLYTCDVCEQQLGRRALSFHFKKKHPGHPIKKTIFRETFHSCKLCQCTMVFNVDNIYQHLRYCHGDLTWKDYKNRYLINGSGPGPGKQSHSLIPSNHNGLITNGQSVEEKTIKRKGNTKQDDMYDSKSSNRIIVTDDINKMCMYTCDICNQKMKHNVLPIHFKRSHPNQEIQKSIYRESFHRCKLCGLTMSFNVQTLSQHLRNHHREVNWKNYKNNFLSQPENLNIQYQRYDPKAYNYDSSAGRSLNHFMDENLSLVNGLSSWLNSGGLSEQHPESAYRNSNSWFQNETCRATTENLPPSMGNSGVAGDSQSDREYDLDDRRSVIEDKSNEPDARINPTDDSTPDDVEGAEDAACDLDTTINSFTNDLRLLATMVCLLCDKEMLRTFTVSKHFKSKHSGQKIQIKYKKVSWHKCKICDNIIKFSCNDMYNHIRRAHRETSWGEYKNIFLDNAPPPLAPPREQLFATATNVGITGSSAAASGLKTNNSAAENTTADGGGSKTVTDDVKLMSTLSCNMCGAELAKSGSAKLHFKTEHPNQTLSTSPRTTTWHKCKLCSKIVKFSCKDMSRHIKKVHNPLNWRTYKSAFLRPAKSKTPPAVVGQRRRCRAKRKPKFLLKDDNDIKDEFEESEEEVEFENLCETILKIEDDFDDQVTQDIKEEFANDVHNHDKKEDNPAGRVQANIPALANAAC